MGGRRTLEEWRRAGRLARVLGRTLFFVDETGRPSSASSPSSSVVLALHGFPSASWDFAPLWPSLMDAGFRVVAPDLLGFGLSEKPPGHVYSVVEQADLVEALLRDRLQQPQAPSSSSTSSAPTSFRPPIHVLAHDYGVSVAQELLARQASGRPSSADPSSSSSSSSLPFDIQSVCFLNGGLFPETHRPRLVQRLLAMPWIGPWAARWTTRSTLERGLRDVFGPDTPPGPELLDRF